MLADQVPIKESSCEVNNDPRAHARARFCQTEQHHIVDLWAECALELRASDLKLK